MTRDCPPFPSNRKKVGPVSTRTSKNIFSFTQMSPSLTFPVQKRGYASWQRWLKIHRYPSSMLIQFIAISGSHPLPTTYQLIAITTPFCNPPPPSPISYPLMRQRRALIAFQTPSHCSESGLISADIVAAGTVGMFSDLKTVVPSGQVYWS